MRAAPRTTAGVNGTISAATPSATRHADRKIGRARTAPCRRASRYTSSSRRGRMRAGSTDEVRFLPFGRYSASSDRLGCLPVGYFLGIILFVGVLGYLDR